MTSFRTITPLLAAFALAGAVTAASAQTTLTMSSWVPPTHSLTRDVLGVWAQNVEKATSGRVKFTMLPKHPSAAPGTFDAVRDGLVDVPFVTASYTPACHPLPLMAELPGAGVTAEINSIAFSRVHWKYFQPNEYKGVKLLGVFTHGPGQMFTVKKQVARWPTLRHEDPQRRRHLRGGGQGARCVAARQPAPESYELLSSGVAEGPSSRANHQSFNLDKVVKYATYFPAASIPRHSDSS